MWKHRLYKAVWHWSENNKLSVVSNIDKDKTKQLTTQTGPSSKVESTNKKPTFYFTDNIDQNQQMIFRQKYQRGVKPHVPNVVTIQDVKDVVMFSANGSIPDGLIKLFCSNDINLLLRSIILYIQLYLKVWEDLEYRRTSYRNLHLKHPISKEREILCKHKLRKLRSRIGQEYAFIISGEEKYKEFHHMNNTLNRSYTGQDMMFYDYLAKFITRAVWVALNRSNYKEIELEISRLLYVKDIGGNIHKEHRVKDERACDSNVLHGDVVKYLSKWHTRSPVISDIFVDPEIPDTLVSNKSSGLEHEKTKFTGMEAALTLPEEVLTRLKLTVGILGQSRDSLEPLLTVKQRQQSIEEQELDKLAAVNTEEVKPKIKMYMYLQELDANIDLKNCRTAAETSNIIDEINLFEKSHLEDSKKSYKLWTQRKNSSWSFFNSL